MMHAGLEKFVPNFHFRELIRWKKNTIKNSNRIFGIFFPDFGARFEWNGTLTIFISKCSNDRINSEMSSDIPSNSANFSKKEWSNYFSVNIPTGPNETDLSGSNMRLTCTACRLNFTGNKTRAVAHFIGGDP